MRSIYELNMDADCLLQKPWIKSTAIHVLLFLTLTLASIDQTTGLPQKIPSERKSGKERWTIDHCFVDNKENYDVTFVVDSSAEKEDFRPVQRFMNEVTKRLRVVENGAQIGIITFGSRVRKVVKKKRWRHQAELKNAILALRPLFQSRINLGKALSLAGLQVNPKGATRGIVILLIGSQFSDSVFRPAKSLLRKNARTIVIAFDKANMTQLRPVASRPAKENLLVMESSNEITMATDSVLSAVCEEVTNGMAMMKSRFPSKKKSTTGNSFLSIGQRSVVSSSDSISVRWSGSSRPQVMNYKILWFPRDGDIEVQVNQTTSRIELTNLNPATMYKIRISPINKKSYRKSLTIIAATAPLPVKNLTVSVEYVEPCSLQKKLQRLYKAKAGIILRPEDCDKNKTVIFVEWNKTVNTKFYLMKMEPKASKLARISKRSTKQVYTNVRPGKRYTASVRSRGPRMLISESRNVTVVIPPQDPIRLHAVVLNSTTAAIRWLMPRSTLFDGFLIDVFSAFGKKSYSVGAPEPVDITTKELRAFYTFILGGLRPDADYRVTVHTESHDVASNGKTTESFSTKFSNDMYNEPFLIISGGDGIYAAPTNMEVVGSNNVQKLFPVVGGVVNALYYSRWIKPTNQIKEQENDYQWQKLLIWIERYSREIKVTDLTSQSKTVTLVKGLLQPVALLIDTYGENIYWTDIGSRSVGVASISTEPGSELFRVNKKLITGDFQTPVSLAIDVLERFLFVGDLKGTIERASMDGTNRILIRKAPLLKPYSMTYCLQSKRLYWIDAISGNLESMKSTGADHWVVYEKTSETILDVSTLVVANGEFYWYNVAKNSIDMFQKQNRSEEFDRFSSVYPESDVPLVTAMTSYDPRTTEKGKGISFTSGDEMLSMMSDLVEPNFPCSSTSCVGVCIPVTMQNSTCSNDCHPWEMLCHRSDKPTCIDKQLACNGVADCSNGEDEDLFECETQLEEAMCKIDKSNARYGCRDTGKCIPYEAVCNGILDCKDGSEEKDCPVQEQICTFEDNDFCMWSQDKDTDDFDWMLHYGGTASNQTGPLMDHTMAKINGSYAYLEATQRDEGNTARLVSVLFAKPICISFYYYMFGRNMGTLILKSRDYKSGEETVLWSKSGDQGVDWNTASISIDKHKLYQLIIEGVRGEDYRSDIAIDDITIKDGLCPVSRYCDFNNFDDLACGYHMGKAWKIISGSIAESGSNASVEIQKPTGMQDLTDVLGPGWFYFNFKSDDDSNCNECDGTRLVRDISHMKYAEDRINYAGVVLCNSTKYKIFLSETLDGTFRNIADGAGKGEDHCEFIGVDDYAESVGEYRECEGDVGYVRRRRGESLQIESYGFYRSIYFATAAYVCGFEFHEQVIENDPKQWLRSLPNSYLRIDYLSMFETGRKSESFQFRIALPPQKKMEAKDTNEKSLEKLRDNLFLSSHKTDVNQTEIKTKSLHPPSWCLKFRYFMIGSDIGSLRVSIDNNYDIWVKNGQQGNNWKNATIVLPYPALGYDVIITTSRKEGYEGSVGIDDVAIIKEPCFPKLQYTCNFDVPLDEECSFSSAGAPSDQVILNPLYKRSIFDPEIVHGDLHESGVITATNIELSNGTTITTYPILRSPVLSSLSRFYPVMCLTVSYRQNANEGYIAAVVRSKSTGKEYTVEKHHLPDEKSVIRPWLTFIAQLNDSVPIAQEEDFYIEFHGLNATWVNSLTLDTVQCSAVIEDLCSNSVRCKNGQCVPPELLCDGINDCGDWSDEIGCPSHCGNVADYFDTSATFEGMHKLGKDTCVHRIHGQPGKQILLTVGKASGLLSSNIAMKVYKGFMQRYVGEKIPGSGYFPSESFLFTTNKFPGPTSYLIESHNATIVTSYSSISLAPVRLSYEMVEESHCSYVCPNHHCLFNNHRCDGNLGCSDGSDEKDCTKVVLKDGVKVLEVQHLDGPYAPICADDITERLADAICKQLGDLYAERPLNKTKLPMLYDGIIPHKLKENITISDNSLLQSFIMVQDDEFKVGIANVPDQPKKTAGQCTSRETWIPNCISYQCGVRPIDVNPFSPGSPALNPILRIIGGEKAEKGRWPWMASLLLKEKDHNCGATLISDRFVVTAAHCFDEHSPELFTVLLGVNSIRNYGSHYSKHTVKRAIIHEAYNKQADIPDWDIALVEVEPTAHFSTYISPICLPEGNMDFPPGTMCYIAGFGHISEGRGSQNVLNEAKTPIISNSQCDANMYRGSISERMLCAGYPKTGGVGICHGDSGGPLMCQHKGNGSWYLVGVTSWSIGCANRLKPDVFTRILSHVAWLNKNTGSNLTLPAQSKPVTGTCGGVYYGQEFGSFASPGWPDLYRSNQDCVYTILADLGQTIHLTFDEFATEMYFDVVDIFSGEMAMTSRIKTQYSGKKKPDPITVRSSALYVHFFSDSDTQERGFLARFRVTGARVSYSGPTHPLQVLLRSSYAPNIVTMVQPMMGFFYYNGIGPGGWPTYQQHISNPSNPGTVYKLEYIPAIGYWSILPREKLSRSNATPKLRNHCVKPTPDLCNSSWELWNGTAWIKILLMPSIVIGATTPKPQISTSPDQLTDSVNSGSIPTAEPASPKCGGILTSLRGEIKSPGYGTQNYSDSISCKWYLDPSATKSPATGSKKRWILLELVDFETQVDHDYLKGFSGNRTKQSSLLFGLSGEGLDLDDKSGTKSQETTTEAGPIEGFEAWLSLLESFGLQTSTTELPATRDNDTTGQKMNSITPVLKYEDETSEGMTLVFSSDDTISGKGFYIRYYILDDLRDSPLTSVKYVIINLTADSGIALQRKKRETDFSDWVTDIGSGDMDSGDFSSYYYPDYFYSDDLLVNPDCNFTIQFNTTGSKQINFTANFDTNSLATLLCIWRIKTKYPLQLVDMDLVLDGYPRPVDFYYFQITNEMNFEIFTLDTVPVSKIEKSFQAIDYAEIHFRTTEKGIGFNVILNARDIAQPKGSSSSLKSSERDSSTASSANVQTTPTEIPGLPVQKNAIQANSNCENVVEYISDESLFIFSPNFPGYYPGNTQCTWVIKTQSMHQIQITFTEMKIEGTGDCIYDNVSVADGENDLTPINVLCGSKIPGKIKTESSVMIVKFTSDRLVQDTGFRALVTVVKSSPKPSENSEEPLFSCDFDSEDICDFRNDKSSDVEFTWLKHFSVTPSENTGPPHDASESGNGYYLYIEASMPRNPGDRARIVSPVIQSSPGNEVCLNFAYSMRGLSVGSLIVYISIASDGAATLSEENTDPTMENEEDETLYQLRPVVLNFGAGLDQQKMIPTYRNNSQKPTWQQYLLWSKTGEQENEQPWLNAQVTFKPNNHFQLLFEGIRGNEYQSDIAIDSILVTQGACEKTTCNRNEISCTGGENRRKLCIPKELECDGHEDCESGSDENHCNLPLEKACNSLVIKPNTTEWMICNNVQKCSLKTDMGRIHDIMCDGVFDCFGGYDESYCDRENILRSSKLFELDSECGKQKGKDKEVVQRSKIHQVSHDQLPWIAGLYLKLSNNDGTSRYVFLCSATFIRDSWLLAPAHCILDPEITKEELNQFIQKRQSVVHEEKITADDESEIESDMEPLNSQWNDQPWLSEINPMIEFQEFFQDDTIMEEEAPQPHNTLEYYITTHPPALLHSSEDSEKEKNMIKVSKLIPHPNYTILKRIHKQDCNTSITEEFSDEHNKERQDISKNIKCDIKRINNDVALIKVDKKSKESSQGKTLEFEDKMKLFGDPKKPGILTPATSVACLNKKLISNPWNDMVPGKSSSQNNIFFPPSEKDAYREEYNKKATCYAIGYSPVTNSEEQKSLMTLSRKSVQVVTGDISARRLVCGLQNRFKPAPDCLELFKKEQNLEPLIVGGYREQKEAAFLHDQGSALICKGWNDRWYLTGIFSWSNIYRNLQHDRLFDPLDKEISGGLLEQNMVIGMPLGIDVFMDVSHVTEWVESTLQDDCPGEFPCYDASSPHPQKCIPKQKLCDGVIDCPVNYLDEINCASGCTYNSKTDPFNVYYQNLEDFGIILPDDVVSKYNLRRDNETMIGNFMEMEDKNPKSILVTSEDETGLRNSTIKNSERSWRSGMKLGTIRVNEVNKEKIKMCIWTIKATEGKVAVLRIQDFHTVSEGNRIQILNSKTDRNEFLNSDMKDLHYTSEVGETITIRILPPINQPYLTDIRHFEADHYTESFGDCKGRHMCGDGKCVSPHHICDRIWDCDDRSDEMNCESGCGGQALQFASSGEISSKNYPFPHNGNGDCEWQFLIGQPTPAGIFPMKQIKFEFMDFNSDIKDVLFLFNGAGKKKTGKDLLAAYSGDRSPFDITVKVRTASISLRSNDFISRRKFLIRYTVL